MRGRRRGRLRGAGPGPGGAGRGRRRGPDRRRACRRHHVERRAGDDHARAVPGRLPGRPRPDRAAAGRPAGAAGPRRPTGTRRPVRRSPDAAARALRAVLVRRRHAPGQPGARHAVDRQPAVGRGGRHRLPRDERRRRRPRGRGRPAHGRDDRSERSPADRARRARGRRARSRRVGAAVAVDRGRHDVRRVREPGGRGVPRLRGAPQRARPARVDVLQLAPAGEPELGQRRRRHARHRPRARPLHVPERPARGVLRAVLVPVLGRVRLPARARRDLALAHGVRPRRRLAHRGRGAGDRLRRRARVPRPGDRPAHRADRAPARAAGVGDRGHDRPPGDVRRRDAGRLPRGDPGRPAPDRPQPDPAERLPDRGLGVPVRRPADGGVPPAAGTRDTADGLLPRVRRAGRDRDRRPARLRRGARTRLRRDPPRRRAVHVPVELQPARGDGRLHRPRGGPLVAGPDPAGARPGRRGLHAGLRRAGPGRHALRGRLDRRDDAQPAAEPRRAGHAPGDQRVRARDIAPALPADLLLHPRGLHRDAGLRPPTRAATSSATRRPTGRARPASPRRRRTCSTGRSAARSGR